MDLPIEISPKMVFDYAPDSLGRDNLNDPILGHLKKSTPVTGYLLTFKHDMYTECVQHYFLVR